MSSLRNDEATIARLVAYDLFVPVATERLPTSDDYAVGATLATASASLRMDAYVQRFRDLTLPRIPSDLDEAPLLVNEDVTTGAASAHGVELSATAPALGGSLHGAYMFAAMEQRTDSIAFPPSWDRRHVFRLGYDRLIGGRGSIATRFMWESGRPYTPARGWVRAYHYQPGAGWTGRDDIATLGAHNSARLPGYVRADVLLRLDYDRSLFGRSGTLSPYLQVFNLSNRRNVLRALPGVAGGRPRVEYAPQAPMLPSIGVSWRSEPAPRCSSSFRVCRSRCGPRPASLARTRLTRRPPHVTPAH